MAKNILLGNGVNIQFSGTDEYKNWAVLERMRKNMAEPGRYIDRFNGTITAGDINDILDRLYAWFTKKASKGTYALKNIKNPDDLTTFLDICRRCAKTSPDVLNMGMEDYLFIIKLFNDLSGYNDLEFETLYQGITPMFADAIYNDGAIEEIYHNMNPLKTYLGGFETIFTVNYDRNIDRISDNEVYHLHGAFDNLHQEYREDTLLGWAIVKSGKKLQPYIKGKEILYSDAVFGYSGKNKMSRMEKYNQPYADPMYADLRNLYPNLECPHYPIDEFKSIKGELYIIGLGPNNDSHIFDLINQNTQITRVYYYFACDDDAARVKNVVKKPLEITNVFELWSLIGA